VNGNGKGTMFDVAERQVALDLITKSTGEFVEGFEQWLIDNWLLWKSFEREALRASFRGRAKYSARTITEYLRHEATMRDPAQEFRLNNSVTPSLSRLFLMKYPDLGDFFETRESRKEGE
jgi:hypothetical protein